MSDIGLLTRGRPPAGALSSAAPTSGAHLHRFSAMAGPCMLHLYPQAGLDLRALAAAAEAEVLRIQAKYSRYRDDSVIAQINASAGRQDGIKVDAETAALLNYAATAHQQSGGVFDISSGVLRRAWDFKAQRPPSAAAVEALLPLVGWHKLHWEPPRLRLPLPGMELDFGGFGKEYAADRVAGLLVAAGLRHGLVDLSGDIRAIGPHPDGRPWQVGIQHPREAGAIATLPLLRGAVASSGDYERGFVHQGRRYSHLLDPRSGWPVQGLASVSVLADSCLIAGTASTTAMLLGEQAGLQWLQHLQLPFLVVDQQLRLQDQDGPK